MRRKNCGNERFPRFNSLDRLRMQDLCVIRTKSANRFASIDPEPGGGTVLDFIIFPFFISIKIVAKNFPFLSKGITLFKKITTTDICQICIFHYKTKLDGFGSEEEMRCEFNACISKIKAALGISTLSKGQKQ